MSRFFYAISPKPKLPESEADAASEISSLDAPAAVVDEIAEISATPLPPFAPLPCPTCNDRIFWQSVYAGWHCSICTPAPMPQMIREIWWVTDGATTETFSWLLCRRADGGTSGNTASNSPRAPGTHSGRSGGQNHADAPERSQTHATRFLAELDDWWETPAGIEVRTNRDHEPRGPRISFPGCQERENFSPPRFPAPCFFCGGRTVHSIPCQSQQLSWCVIPHGRYRGKSPAAVPRDYLSWLLRNGDGLDSETREMVRKILAGEFSEAVLQFAAAMSGEAAA